MLLDEAPSQGLGRALVWAAQGAPDETGSSGDRPVEVHVVASSDADVVARRASAFARPVHVWQIEGNHLREVAPAPPPAVVAPPPEALDLVGLLAGAGAEIVIEHGVVTGEVLGLEVARVVVDDRGARVEVGVGRHDREAFALVHGDTPTDDALRAVIDRVRAHRRPGAPAHPIKRLAAERWMRSMLVSDPVRVGLTALEPLEPTVPRTSVKEVAAAVAMGTDPDGGTVVVACSVGIDLDLVPAAADARLAHAPDARLVLVVPARDAHPATRRLASALHRTAQIVELEGDWRG